VSLLLIILSSLLLLLVVVLYILTANGFSPGGSGTAIRHNTQITHITQNYTNNKGHTTHNEYSANTITATTNTITTTII
jgi:hypothetical protein